jgi:hypothetical protein
VLNVVLPLPIWYRSSMFRRIAGENGGWILVVGFVVDYLAFDVCVSFVCGRSRIRPL